MASLLDSIEAMLQDMQEPSRNILGGRFPLSEINKAVAAIPEALGTGAKSKLFFSILAISSIDAYQVIKDIPLLPKGSLQCLTESYVSADPLADYRWELLSGFYLSFLVIKSAFTQGIADGCAKLCFTLRESLGKHTDIVEEELDFFVDWSEFVLQFLKRARKTGKYEPYQLGFLVALYRAVFRLIYPKLYPDWDLGGGKSDRITESLCTTRRVYPPDRFVFSFGTDAVSDWIRHYSPLKVPKVQEGWIRNLETFKRPEEPVQERTLAALLLIASFGGITDVDQFVEYLGGEKHVRSLDWNHIFFYMDFQHPDPSVTVRGIVFVVDFLRRIPRVAITKSWLLHPSMWTNKELQYSMIKAYISVDNAWGISVIQMLNGQTVRSPKLDRMRDEIVARISESGNLIVKILKAIEGGSQMEISPYFSRLCHREMLDVIEDPEGVVGVFEASASRALQILLEICRSGDMEPGKLVAILHEHRFSIFKNVDHPAVFRISKEAISNFVGTHKIPFPHNLFEEFALNIRITPDEYVLFVILVLNQVGFTEVGVGAPFKDKDFKTFFIRTVSVLLHQYSGIDFFIDKRIFRRIIGGSTGNFSELLPCGGELERDVQGFLDHNNMNGLYEVLDKYPDGGDCTVRLIMERSDYQTGTFGYALGRMACRGALSFTALGVAFQRIRSDLSKCKNLEFSLSFIKGSFPCLTKYPHFLIGVLGPVSEYDTVLYYNLLSLSMLHTELDIQEYAGWTEEIFGTEIDLENSKNIEAFLLLRLIWTEASIPENTAFIKQHKPHALLTVVCRRVNTILERVYQGEASAENIPSMCHLLNNLGTFLGYITLSNDIPIRTRCIDIAKHLRTAYSTGTLDVFLPFLRRVLEPSRFSRVFTASNVWIQRIGSMLLGILSSSRDAISERCEFEIRRIFTTLKISPSDLVADSDIVTGVGRPYHTANYLNASAPPAKDYVALRDKFLFGEAFSLDHSSARIILERFIAPISQSQYVHSTDIDRWASFLVLYEINEIVIQACTELEGSETEFVIDAAMHGLHRMLRNVEPLVERVLSRFSILHSQDATRALSAHFVEENYLPLRQLVIRATAAALGTPGGYSSKRLLNLFASGRETARLLDAWERRARGFALGGGSDRAEELFLLGWICHVYRYSEEKGMVIERLIQYLQDWVRLKISPKNFKFIFKFLEENSKKISDKSKEELTGISLNLLSEDLSAAIKLAKGGLICRSLVISDLAGKFESVNNAVVEFSLAVLEQSLSTGRVLNVLNANPLLNGVETALLKSDEDLPGFDARRRYLAVRRGIADLLGVRLGSTKIPCPDASVSPRYSAYKQFVLSYSSGLMEAARASVYLFLVQEHYCSEDIIPKLLWSVPLEDAIQSKALAVFLRLVVSSLEGSERIRATLKSVFYFLEYKLRVAIREPSFPDLAALKRFMKWMLKGMVLDSVRRGRKESVVCVLWLEFINKIDPGRVPAFAKFWAGVVTSRVFSKMRLDNPVISLLYGATLESLIQYISRYSGSSFAEKNYVKATKQFLRLYSGNPLFLHQRCVSLISHLRVEYVVLLNIITASRGPEYTRKSLYPDIRGVIERYNYKSKNSPAVVHVANLVMYYDTIGNPLKIMHEVLLLIHVDHKRIIYFLMEVFRYLYSVKSYYGAFNLLSGAFAYLRGDTKTTRDAVLLIVELFERGVDTLRNQIVSILVQRMLAQSPKPLGIFKLWEKLLVEGREEFEGFLRGVRNENLSRLCHLFWQEQE